MDKVRIMKVYLLKLFALFLIICSLVSCSDPIFYLITEETPLIKPLIDGSPTNFAVFDNEMYVATGKMIFNYKGKKWAKFSGILPDHNFIIQLASTDTSLYALYISGSNGRIRRFFDDGNLDGYTDVDVNLSGNVQSIYTLDNTLFACVRNNTTYTVFYKKEADADFKEIPIKISDTEPLNFIINGVASDGNYYYFSTFSRIFYVEISNIDSSVEIIKDKENNIITDFTGIINLNPTCVAAVTRKGVIYEIKNATATEKIRFRDGRFSTGALAIWKDKNNPAKTLFLIGRREDYYSTTSSYSNGYVEIELDTTGNIPADAKFADPGKNPLSTITGYERYVSSLGKKLVNYFIQTPASIDPEMTLFAATHKDGVWSYRDHNDGEGVTWNAEK
jgi:hypothetical protein